MTDKSTLQANKEAVAPSAVDDDIRSRWSPRSFASRDVTDAQLRILLHAARWAPSSFNEQPWRFIVARRRDSAAFDKLLSCIDESNRSWARRAPVLMLTATSTRFSRTGRENRHAYHDLGLAMGNLVNQATSMNLYVHQMAGIDPERARDLYGVPEGCDVVAGAAIGYLGEPSALDDPDRRRAEKSARSRKPLDELVFEARWGHPADFAKPAR